MDKFFFLAAVASLSCLAACTKPSAGDYVMKKCDGFDEVTVSSPENLTAWEICLNEALEEYKRKYP